MKVAPVTKKITGKRLTWYGHVKRREEEHILRMLDTPVQGYEMERKTEYQVERLE